MRSPVGGSLYDDPRASRGAHRDQQHDPDDNPHPGRARATLTYDVRRNDASTEPILLLIGAPMGAAGFGTLSRHFSDRTVVTYDPRGTERSVKTDPTSPVTPDVHADDLHRLIQAIDGGPVDLFASSGGAVNALARMAKHPEDVRTLVAHEPALASILPDREHALAATSAVHETYQRSGWGAGVAHFIALSSHQGPFTAEHGSSWPPARSPRARWRTVAPSPSPGGSAPSR
jgi:pimeloyl-ACP methyl ester carboxylesterase